MSITASYEEIPDTLKKYLRSDISSNGTIPQKAKEMLLTSGIGETHRLLGARERYCLSSTATPTSLVEEKEIEWLCRSDPKWRVCSTITSCSNIYRCPIYIPQIADLCAKEKDWNTADKVIEALGKAEIGSKYRLLTNQEILLAEYGTHGRYAVGAGTIEMLCEFPPVPSWEVIPSNLGNPNTYNYYRVPIDLPFLTHIGMPATADDEIPEDVLRFSFLIPSG